MNEATKNEPLVSGQVRFKILQGEIGSTYTLDYTNYKRMKASTHNNAVFEIKVLFYALAWRIDPGNGAPGHLFMCYPLYKPI